MDTPTGAAPDIPMAGSTAAPVPERDRIRAMDSARGLALLGILCVNIQLFAEAFGTFLEPRPESTDPATQACFYFVKIFCEGKFYPLFSMLFGMGLILQMGSVARRDPKRSFGWLYLRRLLVLMAIGLLHALLVWYGDILFVYSIAGTALLLARRLSGRTLLTIGLALALTATLIGSVLGAAMRPGQQRPAPPAAVTTTDRPPDGLDRAAENSPFFSLMRGFRDGQINGGPEQPMWMELETRAYREGPYREIFLFRGFTWIMYLAMTLLIFGWHVVGMFFIGAGLLKSGFFEPHRRGLRRRLALVGLFAGVPLAALSVMLIGRTPGALEAGVGTMLLYTAGPLVCLMYLSGISLLVDRATGFIAKALGVLASVGRMALSNYLMHSLICTTIFYAYGLAQFGEWTRPQRMLLVAGIFAVQCIISPLWLSRFRFGPMEWVWRSLTYLRPQPMRRGNVGAGEP